MASNEIVTVKGVHWNKNIWRIMSAMFKLVPDFCGLLDAFPSTLEGKRKQLWKLPSSPWLRNSPREQMVLSFKPWIIVKGSPQAAASKKSWQASMGNIFITIGVSHVCALAGGIRFIVNKATTWKQNSKSHQIISTYCVMGISRL